MTNPHERIAQLNREFQSQILNYGYFRDKTIGEWLVSASFQDLKEIQYTAINNQTKFQLGKWKPEILDQLPEPARTWEYLAVVTQLNMYEIHNLEDTLMLQEVPKDWVELIFEFKKTEFVPVAVGNFASVENRYMWEVFNNILTAYGVPKDVLEKDNE